MEKTTQITKDSSYLNPELSIEARVQALLSQMTLDEKIGQMTQVEKGSITPDEVRDYFIGSVLSGGGGNPSPNSVQSWDRMVRSFLEPGLTTRLAIPLIYGSDAVHGHNNVVGAVIFPHNIGLGASRDADLVERIARVVAAECEATSVRWAFAPAVSVPQDIRWGRSYEGFAENTDLVSQLGAALVRGLQNADGNNIRGALASVKHYVADGGTRWDKKPYFPWTLTWTTGENEPGIDEGNADIDESVLRTVHLPPYRAAIEAGAMNIMISYSSWQGLKMHAHHYLLTDVLKGEMGFKGFLVSDWYAIEQLSPDYLTCVTTTINAGVDMVMVPFDFKRFIQTLHQAVANGDVSHERIDDAVSRILTVKFRMGLFERPFNEVSPIEQVGAPAHREIAREAVRKSLVLLKNEHHVLPLKKTAASILVAGEAANNIGLQCGGWTIDWMGRSGDVTPGTTTLAGIRQAVSDDTTLTYSADAEFAPEVHAEVGILIIAEEPYAEGMGDRADLTIPAKYSEVTERLKQHCDHVVTILFSGRPMIITDQLGDWDAFVAAWLPGTEGQGIADVLFGDVPFTGKLSYTWPRSMDQVPLSKASNPLWTFGSGLIY